MKYVYYKVAGDCQSHQTHPSSHIFREGDCIHWSHDNGHLSSTKRDDFLIDVLPERPEPPPLASLLEVKPVFAAKNGYGDPESATFGQNDWTGKLGVAKYRGGPNSDVISATHWLALVSEP